MIAAVPEALSSAPLWISRPVWCHRQAATEADVIVVSADDDRFFGAGRGRYQAALRSRSDDLAILREILDVLDLPVLSARDRGTRSVSICLAAASSCHASSKGCASCRPDPQHRNPLVLGIRIVRKQPVLGIVDLM